MNIDLHQMVETPLDLTRRLMGSSAIVTIPNTGDITVELDIEGFIRRLLLFDTYVLYSVRLKEIPCFVKAFGLTGTLELLKSGAIEVLCECAQFMEGQINTPSCPLLTFQFHIIEAHIWGQYLINNLSEVNRTPGLTSREMLTLQEAVMRAVRRRGNLQMFRSDVAPAFEADVLHNIPLLKAAIRFVLATSKKITNVDDFELRFHKIGDDRYETETTLPNKITLGLEEIHNVIKSALLGVSSIDQRIGEMKVNSALSGFTEEELPLFGAKLDTLAGALGSSNQEHRFRRVVSISGLPAFSGSVDIEKLLEIRDSLEAREFRASLPDMDKLTDNEIKDLVSGFNSRVGLAVQTSFGKVVRCLVTSALGFASPPAGVALSLLDYFVWDKFFRRSGMAAFIHELYPSIFKHYDRRVK